MVTQENRDFFENRTALLNFENASVTNFHHLKLQIHYIWLTLMEVSIETCFSKFKRVSVLKKGKQPVTLTVQLQVGVSCDLHALFLSFSSIKLDNGAQIGQGM